MNSASLHRRIGFDPGQCVYGELDVVCSLSMTLGAPVRHVATKSLLSILYGLCCVNSASLHRRIGFDPGPCVYGELDVVCSLAMALGAPVLHVATKSLMSIVSLGRTVCMDLLSDCG